MQVLKMKKLAYKKEISIVSGKNSHKILNHPLPELVKLDSPIFLFYFYFNLGLACEWRGEIWTNFWKFFIGIWRSRLWMILSCISLYVYKVLCKKWINSSPTGYDLLSEFLFPVHTLYCTFCLYIYFFVLGS